MPIQAPQRILIVGGGTAGWMTANLLARSWSDRGVEIALLESPDIGIIGVGEGSTPQLKTFFDVIGVDEADWMPKCNATYKVGISFTNWSTKPGYPSYFHPFPSQTDLQNAQAFVYHCYLRRLGVDVDAHPNRYFVPAYLAAHRLGPKPERNFPFRVQYGYHFDSYLVGQFLRALAVGRGVRHLEGEVAEVPRSEGGDIAGLRLADGRRLDADCYVDCTGFRGLLLQQALKVPFRSFAANLFNDAAVVLPTPPGPGPNSQTISTALRHGWAWDIPLTNRTGNGYVYSSAYCSADAAEQELRGKLGLLDAAVAARHLKMRVGRVESHWHRNCLAVGLSQGFIEPLEATALHLVHETIAGFIASHDEAAAPPDPRPEFNRLINRRFDGIRDYIVCHYKVNSRRDTDYWRANAANEQLSDSLRRLLATWLEREDLTLEIERQQIGTYYSTVSWHCLFAGYGVFPEGGYRPPQAPRETRYDLAETDDFVARCALNFRAHAAQLPVARA
jgi:2-polyprenyl-6-methoxyphenol hydroxylase-like FAD-dependent oxidoreductase